MEGIRRRDPEQSQSPQPNDGRGRSASAPTQIPTPGWRDILLRAKASISKDNLSIIAGGTAFFILLGLVPGLAALISIYGLIANPSDIEKQLASFSHVMPAEVRTVLEGQMTRISSEHQ